MTISKVWAKKENKGSDLGRIWAVVKPMMYIAMFYFAITLGFKSSKGIDGILCPYYIWMSAGMVPWFYIQDLIYSGANSFRMNKALITKTKYPIAAVPLIPVLTNLRVHLVMVLALFGLALVFGVTPCVYWLQVFFYMPLSVLFVYLWSLLMGMLNAVSADVLNLIKTVKPAFFWLSGILFNSRGMENLKPVFSYNPISFIVEGYRNAICYNQWFWEDPGALLDFGEVMLGMLILTLLVYGRLRDRIAEIL